MSMTLTTDDLQALTKLIDSTVRPIVEDAIEDSKRHTAAGFAEVHQKFAEIDDRFAGVEMKLDTLQTAVDRIERVQRAEIQRVDHQETAINKMRKALKAL